MTLSEKRKGELYIFGEVLIWGLFPIVTVLSYVAVPSAVSLLWSIFFAALFFAAMLTYRKRWSELGDLLLWKYCVYIALSIGVLFYGLFFVGLETTTPGNAAIIVLFEIFTSFVFFRIVKKDYFSVGHILGALLMVVGAGIILAPNFSGFKAGDFLILAATFFTPVGNLYQQKARLLASSEAIMFLRGVLSLPFILALVYLLHGTVFVDIRPALLLLIINGVLLLGLSKIFWIEAVHRMSVPKGTALQGFGPFVTLVLAWIILHQAPTVWQLASLAPLLLGILLLTDHLKLFSHSKRT